MAIAAASTAARSIFRSSSLRNATSRLASQAKSARSPFGLPSRTPLAHRIFRNECVLGVNATVSHCHGLGPDDLDAYRLSLWIRLASRRYLARSVKPSFSPCPSFLYLLAMMIYDRYHPSKASKVSS